MLDFINRDFCARKICRTPPTLLTISMPVLGLQNCIFSTCVEGSELSRKKIRVCFRIIIFLNALKKHRKKSFCYNLLKCLLNFFLRFCSTSGVLRLLSVLAPLAEACCYIFVAHFACIANLTLSQVVFVRY